MEYLLRNACYNTSGQYFSLNAPPVVRAPHDLRDELAE
jgi:hypothetical protein